MRVRGILAFAAAFVLAAVALGQRPVTEPIFIPASDVKFTDLDPVGAPGVKIADVWGDHTKGAYGAFLKFPSGFVSPLHTHTTQIKIVVVSGTYVQTPVGQAEHRMPPGSYAMQPGGSYTHVSACDKATGECMLFIESPGKFDLIPAEAPKK